MYEDCIKTENGISTLTLNYKKEINVEALFSTINKHNVQNLFIIPSISLKNKQIEAIIKVLETNTTVTNFTIFNVPIASEDATALGKLLKTNTTIAYLNLSYCNINNDEITKIAEGLETNTTITGIDLPPNMAYNILNNFYLDNNQDNEDTTDHSPHQTILEITNRNLRNLSNIIKVFVENQNLILDNNLSEVLDFEKYKKKEYENEYKVLRAAIKNSLLVSPLSLKEKLSEKLNKEKAHQLVKKVDSFIDTHLFQLAGVYKELSFGREDTINPEIVKSSILQNVTERMTRAEKYKFLTHEKPQNNYGNTTNQNEPADLTDQLGDISLISEIPSDDPHNVVLTGE